MVKMIYPLLTTGSTKMRFVTKENIANQFYSDLVTRLPDKMDTHGTKIHIFYAAKMGKKYLKRYHKYFDSPKIYKDNLRHEELLVCYPDQWVSRVSKIARSK